MANSRVFTLLASLVVPDKTGAKTYAQLVDALAKHYNPQLSEILQIFRCHTRFRKEDESVVTYISVLRELAQKCNFQARTLSGMLDWFVVSTKTPSSASCCQRRN